MLTVEGVWWREVEARVAEIAVSRPEAGQAGLCLRGELTECLVGAGDEIVVVCLSASKVFLITVGYGVLEQRKTGILIRLVVVEKSILR